MQKDVFAFQDEITRQIASVLQVRIAHGELARLWHGQTKDLRAWKNFVEARGRHLRWNEADNRLAQTLLRDAIEIDPNYTAAMVLLGLCLWQDARAYVSVDVDEALASAQELGERALGINPTLGSAYQLLGAVAFLRDRHDEAVALCRRGRDLAPGDSWSQAFFGMICHYADDPKTALASLRTALRLSPYPPTWHVYHLSLASLWAGELEAATEWAERYRELEPDDPFGSTNLAIVYASQGRREDAAKVVAELKRQYPLFGVAEIVRSEHYKDPRKLDRIVAALRRAGLPG
jgi:adenylate cyclase